MKKLLAALSVALAGLVIAGCTQSESKRAHHESTSAHHEKKSTPKHTTKQTTTTSAKKKKASDAAKTEEKAEAKGVDTGTATETTKEEKPAQ